MATEEPKYEVVCKEGDMELRHYAPMLIAEAEVEGSMDEASNQGFRLIADYIFGNNQSSDAEQKARIAMTAPVTVEPQSLGSDMKAARRWHVHFVMPSQYTLETIPKPRNLLVQLREVPGKHYAVHRYSGLQHPVTGPAQDR